MAAAGVVAAVGTGATPAPIPAAAPTSRAAAAPPPTELVNVAQFEEEARSALPPAEFETIAGGDREAFERFTLHPRLGEPTLDMDLTARVLGQALYTPIIVGPMAGLGRYHAGAEVEMIRGAEASFTLTVVSAQSSQSISEIASAASDPFWFNVYSVQTDAVEKVRGAVGAGATGVWVTTGVSAAAAQSPGISAMAAPIDWDAVQRIRDAAGVPVGVKGIRTVADASAAVERGFESLVVSDFGADVAARSSTPMDMLPTIVDEVGGRASVLIDGGFRRGTDVLKALILGAHAVMISRPIAWGLAAYGAEGVQVVLQRIQVELARNFGLIGASNPGELTRPLIRRHERITT